MAKLTGTRRAVLFQINGRILTLQGVLKRLTDKAERVSTGNIIQRRVLKSFQAEEKAEINAQIIEEKAAAVKETQINNLEASANEDNMLERIR